MIVHLKFNLLYDLSMKYMMKNASGVMQPFQQVISSYITSCTVRLWSTEAYEDFITDKRVIQPFLRLLVNRTLYYG